MPLLKRYETGGEFWYHSLCVPLWSGHGMWLWSPGLWVNGILVLTHKSALFALFLFYAQKEMRNEEQVPDERSIP